MRTDLIVGNVVPLREEIERMNMDAQDAVIRLAKLQEKYDKLVVRFVELEARAAALVWSVPAEIRVGELQALAEEFRQLRSADKKRRAAQAARRQLEAWSKDVIANPPKVTPEALEAARALLAEWKPT